MVCTENMFREHVPAGTVPRTSVNARFGSWKNWGRGAIRPPPLEISAVDRAITAKICTMVVCDVIYKIVYLDFPK